MDIFKIIEEAVYYPTNDLRGWGFIAAIFFVNAVLEQLAFYYSDFAIIFYILMFIVSIFLLGVNLTIIKQSIDGSEHIPMIDPMNNFIDGIKGLIVDLVYCIIPTILTLLIAILLGVFSNFEKFVLSLNTSNVSNATATQLMSTVPSDVIQSLFTSIFLVGLFALILFVTFVLFQIIGRARLADTGNIIEALNFKAVIEKISNIGWGNYILFIITLLLLTFFFGIISGIVSLIPYIGRIIATVIVGSYMLIVIARAVGLVYREGY